MRDIWEHKELGESELGSSRTYRHRAQEGCKFGLSDFIPLSGIDSVLLTLRVRNASLDDTLAAPKGVNYEPVA
jgi:hypothetical protein